MTEQPYDAKSPAAPPLARPTTMRAVVQDAYGSPDVLELRDIPIPDPASDEILIKVAATSLNAADWHIMSGEPLLMRPVFGLRRPREQVQGRDVAGWVAAVGSAVSGFRPGDEVFGRAGRGARAGGALAQYVCACADQVVCKPATLTFEHAAALPLAANTALQGLRDAGEIAPGQRVLVNGASGGVGTFAVQIAKALGGHVTGVCSTRNVDLVASLGADHVIDYTRQDFTRLDTRYDLIFDVVPNRSLSALRRVMTPGGTLVIAGGDGGRWLASIPLILRAVATSPFVGQRLRILDEKPSADNLHLLAEWIESGKLRAVIDRVYPLTDTAEAMRYLIEEHARGKVVVTP